MSVIPFRRRIVSFSRFDETDEIVFSRLDHEWTPTQEYNVPIRVVAGASYGVNVYGTGAPIKRIGTERLTFSIRHEEDGTTVDEQIEALNTRLHSFGIGKLWMELGDGTRRWAKAEAVSAPAWTFGVVNREWVSVNLEFVRLSDWYGEDEIVVTQDVTATGTSIEVTNPGSTIVRNAVIEIASLGADGYINPRISHPVTTEWFQINATGEDDQMAHRLDTGRYRLEVTENGGGTWTRDNGNLALNPNRAAILTLNDGVNEIEYSQLTGTPNVRVTIRFRAAYG